MKKIDMDKNRRDQTPPLMLFANQVIDLSAISNQHVIRKEIQHTEIHPARLPHQNENKNIRHEKCDGELVRAVENGTRKAHCFVFWCGFLGRICCGPDARSANGTLLLARPDN